MAIWRQKTRRLGRVDSSSAPNWHAHDVFHPLQHTLLILSLRRISEALLQNNTSKQHLLSELHFLQNFALSSVSMKSRNGLALVFLTFLSNHTTLTFAQYVTTVTEYINDNPFCTPANRIEASRSSAGGVTGSGTSGSGDNAQYNSTGKPSGFGTPGANGGGAVVSASASASGRANGFGSDTGPATNGR